MKKRRVFNDKMVMEKYLVRDRGTDVVGSFIEDMLKNYRDEHDPEKQLMIIQHIILIALQHYTQKNSE